MDYVALIKHLTIDQVRFFTVELPKGISNISSMLNGILEHSNLRYTDALMAIATGSEFSMLVQHASQYALHNYALFQAAALGINITESLMYDGQNPGCIIIENIQGQNAAWGQDQLLKDNGFQIIYTPDLSNPQDISSAAYSLGGSDYAVWNPTSRELLTLEQYVGQKWFNLSFDDPHRAPFRYSAIEFVVSDSCTADHIKKTLDSMPGIQTGWHKLLQRQDNGPIPESSPALQMYNEENPQQGLLPSEDGDTNRSIDPTQASNPTNYGAIGIGIAAVILTSIAGYSYLKRRRMHNEE
ncbi:MAG: hypothetical protein NDI94_05670 [Candidatus Woesearchaeota archaeon]|nr:hypothetical protein [Candidatus Woesearchaeota archaeon]